MTHLLTTSFLRSGGTLAQLQERSGIGAKRHGEFPNLVMLKYDQIESPMAEPLVQECRGLILDEADGWAVVSFPYRKFFNYGEGNAASIDWPTARVYEKLDGSLMTLYFYRGEWRVASSGMPDAGGPAHAGSGTFAGLFFRTWKRLGYELPDAASPLCFMFELMTPENRVVVPHSTPRLVLHGARNLETFEEVQPEPVALYHDWECVQTYPLASIDDCLCAAKELRPMECEGYVVVDSAFRRVKVKSPQYVALAHMKENFSARRMLEVVRANESDEFLTYFPEMRPLFEAVKGQYAALCEQVADDYLRLSGIMEQKAFALEAVRTRCSSALFAMRSGKTDSPRAFFASATLQAVERALPELAAVESEVFSKCLAPEYAPEANTAGASATKREEA